MCQRQLDTKGGAVAVVAEGAKDPVDLEEEDDNDEEGAEAMPTCHPLARDLHADVSSALQSRSTPAALVCS